MSQITVTLPDGSGRTLPAGTPVRDVAGEICPATSATDVPGGTVRCDPSGSVTVI